VGKRKVQWFKPSQSSARLQWSSLTRLGISGYGPTNPHYQLIIMMKKELEEIAKANGVELDVAKKLYLPSVRNLL
jgi:hypothetical protein